MTTRRLVRALDLIDDEALIALYRGWHEPDAIWPEVIDHIRQSGVLAMEIWATGNRLAMVMEVAPDYPRAIPEPPRIAEWEALMDRFQSRLPRGHDGQKWTEMERIFTLDPDTAR